MKKKCYEENKSWIVTNVLNDHIVQINGLHVFSAAKEVQVINNNERRPVPGWYHVEGRQIARQLTFILSISVHQQITEWWGTHSLCKTLILNL